MVDLAPPAPVSSAAATVSPLTSITPVNVTLGNVPDKIQQLLRVLQLNATVAQLPEDGSTITLNTALGSLTLQLPQLVGLDEQKLLQSLAAYVQNQRPLTILIQPGNPPTQATLLLPSSSGASSQGNGAPLPLNVAVQTLPSLQPPPLTVGTSLSAIVLPSDTALPPASVPPPAAPSGLQQAPQASTLPGQTAPLSPLAPQAPQQFTATATPEILVASSKPLLQPGQEITLQINSISSPSQPPLAPQASQQLTATVVGNAPNGQLILKAGDATLYVRQNVQVPVGTNLLVTIEPLKTTTPLPLTLPTQQNSDTLQQVFDSLAQVDPQLATQILKMSVPQPGTSAFPGTLLFMLSAFKQGDTRSWLGNAALDTLTKAGKTELLGKLMQGLNESGLVAQDGVVGEWKSYPVPTYNNQQFQLINFYVHSDGHKQQNSSAEPSAKQNPSHVRFLIDVRFSQLGPLQLDGFAQTKKLDIIIRSEQTLPPGLHHELRSLYTKALSGLGYAGSLNFQVGRNGWITMQPSSHKTLSM